MPDIHKKEAEAKQKRVADKEAKKITASQANEKVSERILAMKRNFEEQKHKREQEEKDKKYTEEAKMKVIGERNKEIMSKRGKSITNSEI